MADPLLDICDDPPGIGLVPTPVKLLGREAESDPSCRISADAGRVCPPPSGLRFCMARYPSGPLHWVDELPVGEAFLGLTPFSIDELVSPSWRHSQILLRWRAARQTRDWPKNRRIVSGRGVLDWCVDLGSVRKRILRYSQAMMPPSRAM